ncbi:MAG TPA: hypothetical protein VGW39_09410 [Chthoniobacterales bacterium]|nr:hypothetical protein [Chthoniobacterales bacterium]
MIAALGLTLAGVLSASGQTQTPGAAPTVSVDNDLSKLSDSQLADLINQKTANPPVSQTQPWDPALVKFLTISVLSFGLLVIITMAVLMLRKSPAGEILRLFTVPMVIVAAVFLVVTGFSNEQITPVIGLLGTLAGYILGVQSQKGDGKSLSRPKDA